MTTNSYLEYFLTLLGWVINNGLWNVLLSTGLLSCRWRLRWWGLAQGPRRGEDEGNKGMLSLPRIENALYAGFLGDDCLLRTAD